MSSSNYIFPYASALKRRLEKKQNELGNTEVFEKWLQNFFEEGNTVTVQGKKYDFLACRELALGVRGMKVYYCSQRGSLDDSLETQKSFSSTKEAIAHIVEDIRENLCCPAFNESNLYIQYYSYDERIESDVFLVSIGSIGKEDYIKKHGCPQAYGWLHCKSEWKDKILEWKNIYEEKYIQAESFVDFFDGTPKVI